MSETRTGAEQSGRGSRLITGAVIAVLLVFGALAQQFASMASRDRGLTIEATWLVEAVGQRVDYYQRWFFPEEGQEGQHKEPQRINDTFGPHGALPPLMPGLVATVQGLEEVPDERPPPSVTAARTNAVFFGVFVAFVGLMGFFAGGPLGAVVAAVGAATTPRLFGIGSSVGFGMSGLLFLTATPFLLHLSGRSRVATALAGVGLMCSVMVSILGLFAWLPWLLIALSRAPHERETGEFSLLPRPSRRALIILGVLALILLTHAYVEGYAWTMAKALLLAAVFFVLGRLLYFVFFHGTAEDGFAATSSVPLRTLLIVPVGLGLGLWAYPYLWVETKEHLLLWLRHFLSKPADPFSYAGELWGHERPPLMMAPVLLAVTVPPAYMLLAFAGFQGGDFYRRLMRVRLFSFLRYLPPAPPQRSEDAPHRFFERSPRDQERKDELLRLAKLMLLLTLLLPLVLRGPYFAGLDLLALCVPWLLVLAAAGLERLAPTVLFVIPWQDLITREQLARLARTATGTVFVILLIFPPVLDVVRYHPMHEAYYSWIIGGPEGARRQGLPRYPKGPLPLPIFQDILAERPQGASIGFMLPGPGYEPAFQMARGDGIPESLHGPIPSFDADVVLLPHDDLDAGYEAAVTNFFRTVHGNAEGFRVYIYERGSVPIFSVAVRER